MDDISKKRIYLYGFRDDHRVVCYRYIDNDKFNFAVLHRVVNNMLDWYPDIVKIFAVDQRVGLAKDFLESFKSKDFVDWICFEDLIKREGVKVCVNR